MCVPDVSESGRALIAAPEGSVSPEEVDNMYPLLGAYRGVSEALLEFAQRAARIDWARLREERI